ncbi:MAG TPA: leucine efflux protein LeuE [Steroidobacteraceae bacterium]
MSDSFFGIVHLPTYIVGTFLVILVPGPNSLFVLSTAARRGVRMGYRAACGVFMGDTILMTLASIGVASILKANPTVFLILKSAGGAYLGYLGINMIVAAWSGRPGTRSTSPSVTTSPPPPSLTPPQTSLSTPIADASPPPAGDPLFRALGISLLNPKGILYCIAFFIQFVDPTYAHKIVSFTLLGSIAQSFSFLYLSLLIFSGARLADSFRRWHRTRTALTGSAGAAFVGFGVKLATAAVN